MEFSVHIIISGIACPADCGNSIDKLQQLKSLHQLGAKITLHYFPENECMMPNELNGYCEKIHLYPARTVKSCCADFAQQLSQNIQEDNHAIYVGDFPLARLLSHIDTANRKVVIRLGNRIQPYCSGNTEPNFVSVLKHLFGGKSNDDTKALLNNRYRYACISKATQKNLKENFSIENAFVLPTFPEWKEVESEEGMGGFCLYHGNLSLPENEKAAIWLINNVFDKIRQPLIIAGKNPSKKLEKIASLCNTHCLIANPSTDEINDLVRKAHIHVLPCFNKEHSGVSLKLLHALYEGKHCIVNDQMVVDSELEVACHIANTPEAFAAIIQQLYHQPFTPEEITLRKHLLEDTFDNHRNAMKLMTWLQ